MFIRGNKPDDVADLHRRMREETEHTVSDKEKGNNPLKELRISQLGDAAEDEANAIAKKAPGGACSY